MFSNRIPEILCASSLIIAATTSLNLTQTQNEKATLESQGALDFRDYASLRRNYFFGHKEMSDILTGMSVLSNTVDAFANSNQPGFEDSKVRARFEDSLGDAKFLARFALGMNDIYAFPALFLLFEEENPERSLELVHIGMRDSRTDIKIPLLGAFISHVFVRDLQSAGNFYKTLYKNYPHHKTPEWVNALADKLLAGDDPYVSNPALRHRLDKMVRTAFPRAQAYFERQEAKRKKGELK